MSWESYSRGADRSLAGFFEELDAGWARVSAQIRRDRDPDSPSRVPLTHPAVRSAINRLVQRLDILENPPASKSPPEIFGEYERRIAGLTQRIYEEWVLLLSQNGLRKLNEAGIQRASWALRCRATTTLEREVGAVLREEIRQTRFDA